MVVGDGEPLPHAYTNAVTVCGDRVTKTYRGADAVKRQQREELAVRSLTGLLPVATVLESTPGVLKFDTVQGCHGQELLEEGHGHAVMFGLGVLLREVQAIRPAFYREFYGTGVLVHGDFGPNNVLFAEHAGAVALLADWEWSTVGTPLTDLAWAEFILRMHHPDHLDCLRALFDGYGECPPWPARQAAMADRAAAIEAWVRSWRGVATRSTWTDRLRSIAQWREVV